MNILLKAFLVTIVSVSGGSVLRAESPSTGIGIGQNPQLPEPEHAIFPTVKIAPAVGWSGTRQPAAADELAVAEYAANLDHPRWLYVLPNGDVLVAETNAPPRPDDGHGIKAWLMRFMMRRAGAGVKSANRISLLRDADGDGVAELKTVFLEGLNSPFGMALVENELFVANTDAILRFPYSDGQTKITDPGTKLADLPAGPINHHWTKNILASRDGAKLYASVGSNSNVAENGIENEDRRACILEVDRATGQMRVYATGLRNPNGMGWEPQSGALWTAVNERDELGNDLVPDYLTSVKDGGFYGWPYSYFGQHIDARVSPQRPDLVKTAIAPDYALGAHTASLGIAFNTSKQLPARYSGGAFVAQHGSWNRNPSSGYKVIFVPFQAGKPLGLPEDVLSGFVNANDEAMGRPVSVVIDKAGALLVADDVGNKIWRVVAAPNASASSAAPE